MINDPTTLAYALLGIAFILMLIYAYLCGRNRGYRAGFRLGERSAEEIRDIMARRLEKAGFDTSD